MQTTAEHVQSMATELSRPRSGVRAAAPRLAATLRERTVTIDGYGVHYRSGGAGPPVILLHGFTLSGALWDSFLDDLMRDFTVVVPDLPGHGGSEAPAGPFRFEAAAQIMHGLLDALRVEKVYGIGHSAGAITLLHMAGQKPERHPALTLIAGAHRFSLEGLELLRHDHFEALDAEMQVCYRAIHPDGDAQIEAIFSRLRGLSGACREFSVPPAYLAAAKSRTLLVFGDRDEYFPMEIVTELARALPNGDLWVVPGQGHTPVWPTLGGSAEAAQHFSTAVRKVFAKPEGF